MDFQFKKIILKTELNAQLQTATNLLSVCTDLLFLDISGKWSHLTCGLLHLPSVTQHSVVEVHACCSKSQYFIPFYGQAIFHCMDITPIIYPFNV